MKQMKNGFGRLSLAAVLTAGLCACRGHMPHAFTWPGGGDQIPTHPKPPEGGYHSNWDPYAATLEVTPANDTNPVRTQHVLVATVRDKDGKPLENRRVEWIISEGSVGDIVEVDESGWRASRGYKVDNHYAVSHTNVGSHVLDRGNDDPSDDIHLEKGQTWCVITSPVEGTTHVTAYAPGIYDWSKHKVFAVKQWYDVQWECPPPATNPTGTPHKMTTKITRYSDGTPLAGYVVNYRVTGGPAATLDPGGSVRTNDAGEATVTLRQTAPAEGTNEIAIEIIRPEDSACCKPAVQIATCSTTKTWIGPKIACTKTAPATALAGQQFEYSITVSNPSQVDANDVMVTDALPAGISHVSSNPPAQVNGNTLSWSLGSIPGNGRKSVTVQVKADKTGKYENCAEAKAAMNLSSRCCASTVVSAPALAIDKECPAEVTMCDPIPVTITVRNSGDGPASNVKLSDTLPAGMTTDSGQSSITADLGTLAPGQAKQVKVNLKASKAGTYNNEAMATADGGLTAKDACTTVVRQPALSLTKNCPPQRFIGRPIVYELVVSNSGDTRVSNVVLTDVVPAGTSFVEASDGGQFSNGRVTWNLGTMETKASKKVTLTVKGTAMGTAKNVAMVKGDCAEATAECTTPIAGISAILLEVVDDPDPIEIGNNTIYTITVTNQGSDVGTNIIVTATLPAELDYVSGEGPTKGVQQAKVIRFDPYPSLAPQAKITYRVTAKGNKAGDVRFHISMKSDQMTGPPVEETESTHVY